MQIKTISLNALTSHSKSQMFQYPLKPEWTPLWIVFKFRGTFRPQVFFVVHAHCYKERILWSLYYLTTVPTFTLHITSRSIGLDWEPAGSLVVLSQRCSNGLFAPSVRHMPDVWGNFFRVRSVILILLAFTGSSQGLNFRERLSNYQLVSNFITQGTSLKTKRRTKM